MDSADLPPLASAHASKIGEPSAPARKFASAFAHRVLALTATEVSKRSGVNESSISRILSEQQGVLLSQWIPVLAAVGFKIVPLDHICIDPVRDAAKTVYAEAGMRCEREHGHLLSVAPELDWNA